MIRTECRACGSTELEQIIDLGPQPLAGGFLSPDAEAVEREKQYPLPIDFCHGCGLVQTLHVIAPEVLFTNYCFSSSTIQDLVDHFERYASWLRERFSPEKVLEFGCNDGILLAPLERLGIEACGIDISENITKIAREKGLDVITGFFDDSSANRVLEEFGRVDVVTGSNCFPHNDEPGIILEAARKVLKPNGHFCVEFMYTADLLETLQWDSMYHEHLSYFCARSLDVLLKRFGLHLVDVERLPMHAGSLRAVAAVDPDEEPSDRLVDLLKYEADMRLTEPEPWREFGSTVQRRIDVVGEVMSSLSANHRICGYGAAGRATMWVNACKMDYLESMIDSSPLRSGRLMPGTHTPIVFPSTLRVRPPDYIFVTAWNYLDTIMEKESWYRGIWTVPLPDLRFF